MCWADTGIQHGTGECVGTTQAFSRAQVSVLERHRHTAGYRSVCWSDTGIQQGTGECVGATQKYCRVQVSVLGRHRHSAGYRWVCWDDTGRQQNAGECVWTTDIQHVQMHAYHPRNYVMLHARPSNNCTLLCTIETYTCMTCMDLMTCTYRP